MMKASVSKGFQNNAPNNDRDPSRNWAGKKNIDSEATRGDQTPKLTAPGPRVA